MNGPGRNDDPAVASYLAAVRDELSDLPPSEAAEIAEDVQEHLEQVAAELGPGLSPNALVERLGAPAAYAAELRAAAGMEPDPPAPTPVSAGLARRALRFLVSTFALGVLAFGALAVVGSLVWAGAVALLYPAVVCLVIAIVGGLLLVIGKAEPVGELRHLPGARLVPASERWLRAKRWGQPAIELVGSLRPAWWVARAALLAVLVGYFVGDAVRSMLVIFLITVVPSVWLGRAASNGHVGGWRGFGLGAANAALAVVGVIFVAAVLSQPWIRSDGVVYVDSGIGHSGDGVSAYNEFGEPVTNLFPYGPDGALLENVRIFDQAGRPFELGPTEECSGWTYDGQESFTTPNPWGDHVFPRLTAELDEYGECQSPTLKPPFGNQLPDPASQPSTPAPAPAPTSTLPPTATQDASPSQ